MRSRPQVALGWIVEIEAVPSRSIEATRRSAAIAPSAPEERVAA
jgi:hypothetical protein